MTEPNEYLKTGYFVESEADSIVRKAREIAGDAADDVEKVKRLFYWVRDNIKYNVYSKILVRDEHKATRTLERGDGNCMQKATLLCALLRAAGIPARLGFADIRNHQIPKDLEEAMGTNLFVFHGFVEALIGGRWVRLTPAFDIKTCEQHGIVPAEFDGARDAMLSPTDVHGRKHFEYVRFHGIFADFPFERMAEACEAAYGHMADFEKLS